MKFSDLAWFALQSLFQQKLRTLLNLVGVLIASFILVFTFAAGEGINQTVTRIFHAEDYLRTIIVHPRYGFDDEDDPEKKIEFAEGIPADKQKRLRSRIMEDWREKSGSWIFSPLTPADIDEIAKLDHVKSVIPNVYSSCVTKFGEHERQCNFQALDPDDKKIRQFLVAGDFPSSTRCNEVLVSEYLAYLWGYRGEEELDQLIGQTVTLHFRITDSNLAYMAQYAASILGEPAAAANSDTDLIDVDSVSRSALTYEETNALIEQIRSIPGILKENDIDEHTIQMIEAMLMRSGGGIGNSPDADDSTDDDDPESENAADDDSNSPPVDSNLVDTDGADAVAENLQAEDITLTMKVTGIVRSANADEPNSRFEIGSFGGNADVWLPLETSIETMRQFEDIDVNGFSSAKVVVTHEDHLEQTTNEIRDLKLNENSLLNFLKFFQGQIAIGKFAMAAIAGVVFFVSGIGITNTMIMSVMERRFEIGVMKAVGAMNGQIVSVFLAEGALIGFLGSGLAVGLARLAAWLLDDLAKQRLESRLGVVIEESIFVFSPTLLISVVGFSALITVLATAFPAWRASSVDPIVSLRSR